MGRSEGNTGLPEGVGLQASPLGGLAVLWGGDRIGWIHESGDQWNAYRAGVAPFGGEKIGRFPKEVAVQQIAIAAGWPGKRTTPDD